MVQTNQIIYCTVLYCTVCNILKHLVTVSVPNMLHTEARNNKAATFVIHRPTLGRSDTAEMQSFQTSGIRFVVAVVL